MRFYLVVVSNRDRYASEVDIDFVRKSVRSIGRCAIKIEESADKCIQALVELIQTRVSYVVQEAVVVIKVCHLNYWHLIYKGYFQTVPKQV